MKSRFSAQEATFLLLPVAGLCAVAWRLESAPPAREVPAPRPAATPIPTPQMERVAVTPAEVHAGADTKVRLSIPAVRSRPNWALRHEVQVWATRNGRARLVAADSTDRSRVFRWSQGLRMVSGPSLPSNEERLVRLRDLPGSLGALELRCLSVAAPPTRTGLSEAMSQVVARVRASGVGTVQVARFPLRAAGQSTPRPPVSTDPGWSVRAVRVEPLEGNRLKVTVDAQASPVRVARWDVGWPMVQSPSHTSLGGIQHNVLRARKADPQIIFDVDLSSFRRPRPHAVSGPVVLSARVSRNDAWPREIRVPLPVATQVLEAGTARGKVREIATAGARG